MGPGGSLYASYLKFTKASGDGGPRMVCISHAGAIPIWPGGPMLLSVFLHFGCFSPVAKCQPISQHAGLSACLSVFGPFCEVDERDAYNTTHHRTTI